MTFPEIHSRPKNSEKVPRKMLEKNAPVKGFRTYFQHFFVYEKLTKSKQSDVILYEMKIIYFT